MPNSCEVLIVGGGPAGSACARVLVDAGMDVLLVDRAQFPRDKVCAGWITPAVVRALQLDLGDYASGRTLQPFMGFRTGPLRGPLRLTSYDGPISYGIRRCEFDEYLLTRSGVRRVAPQSVQDVRRTGDGWTVNGTITARMIVGAGGHFCPVARAIGNGERGSVVAAQEIEFPLDQSALASCPVDSEFPELYFWPDLVGYGWCVRKGQYMNVGAGRLSPASLPSAMREFTGSLGDRSGLLPEHANWKGHAYLLNRTSRRRVHDDRALLVGDAAGLALAPSGEGILAAVDSGMMAADVILDARHDYSAPRVAAYAQRVDDRFGPRARAKQAERGVPSWVMPLASAAVFRSGWLTRHVLLNRAFLHTNRPDLERLSKASEFFRR